MHRVVAKREKKRKRKRMGRWFMSHKAGGSEEEEEDREGERCGLRGSAAQFITHRIRLGPVPEDAELVVLHDSAVYACAVGLAMCCKRHGGGQLGRVGDDVSDLVVVVAIVSEGVD